MDIFRNAVCDRIRKDYGMRVTDAMRVLVNLMWLNGHDDVRKVAYAVASSAARDAN